MNGLNSVILEGVVGLIIAHDKSWFSIAHGEGVKSFGIGCELSNELANKDIKGIVEGAKIRVVGKLFFDGTDMMISVSTITIKR